MTTMNKEGMNFTIPLVPVPKARARSSRGHHYTPQKTREFENLFRSLATIEASKQSWIVPEEPVNVGINFFVSNTNVDLDNLGKSVLDAITPSRKYPDVDFILKGDSIRYINFLALYAKKVSKGEECIKLIIILDSYRKKV